MHIHLHPVRVTDALEGMDLASFDDENVPGPRLEFFTVNGVAPATLSDELNFVVRMAMRAGTFPGKSVQEKDRDLDVTVVGADEVVGASNEREIFLTNPIHCDSAPTVRGKRARSRRPSPAEKSSTRLDLPASLHPRRG
jgi:hypothetical protein